MAVIACESAHAAGWDVEQPEPSAWVPGSSPPQAQDIHPSIHPHPWPLQSSKPGARQHRLLLSSGDLFLKWCCEYTERCPWRFIYFEGTDSTWNFIENRDRCIYKVWRWVVKGVGAWAWARVRRGHRCSGWVASTWQQAAVLSGPEWRH